VIKYETTASFDKDLKKPFLNNPLQTNCNP